MIVLFYTPSAETTKAIFEKYAGELAKDGFEERTADTRGGEEIERQRCSKVLQNV